MHYIFLLTRLKKLEIWNPVGTRAFCKFDFFNTQKYIKQKYVWPSHDKTLTFQAFDLYMLYLVV